MAFNLSFFALARRVFRGRAVAKQRREYEHDTRLSSQSFASARTVAQPHQQALTFTPCIYTHSNVKRLVLTVNARVMITHTCTCARAATFLHGRYTPAQIDVRVRCVNKTVVVLQKSERGKPLRGPTTTCTRRENTNPKATLY